MIKEFKEFIMRGSVLDLAVGVVIGSAFTAIVTKIVDGLITPLISLVFVVTTGKQSADDALGSLIFTVKGVPFKIGDVISAIITFLITAFVLFLIVKTANRMKKKPTTEKTEEILLTSEDYLEQIRDLLVAQNDNATVDSIKESTTKITE